MNKEVIKNLYKEYKKEYINELYDIPFKFETESDFPVPKYDVYDDEGKKIAYFLFYPQYNINISPVDYKKYNLNKYWDVSWYFYNIPKEEKNTKTFIKITSTAFKIIDDFITKNNHPPLLGFGGLTSQHERIYSDPSFIKRWKILFGEKYYVEWKNDKLWIINKNFYKTDESKLYKQSIFQERSVSEIYKESKFPTKSKLKGISKHNLIKEQIQRIILKQIYLKNKNI
jgi:hypothetical protein